jgi:hypothetical protein
MRSQLLTTTKKNMTFQKVQLDWNVHIDQRGWLFWLKVWGMKDMSYCWLKRLTRVTFLTMWTIQTFGQKGQRSIMMIKA